MKYIYRYTPIYAENKMFIGIYTGWAKKPDHFLKCMTPVYDEVGKRSIYQNVELFIRSKTIF